MQKDKQKVAIAMSGGVDSSVAAILLKEQGYDVFGVFMKFWSDPKLEGANFENKCCSVESKMLAQRVADKLDFPLYTLNFKQDFKKIIVDNFIESYAQGITPNPCVACNKFIKFDLLLKKVKALGADYLATGHYAKIINKKNKYYLYRGEDVSKDQSYFLYNLTQTQLKHILFPNSNYIKNDIRKLAAQHKIPQAKIKDSQDVCFAPRKHHDKFLKKNIPKKYQQPGDIILDGEKVGEHKGLPFFTYGQRQGINLGGQGPYYVIGWNKKNNQLFISKDAQDKKIMSNSFTIKNVHWISEPPKSTQKYDCQIRYQAKPIKAKIQKNKITLSTKVRAISPGQSAVFYKGKQVLGGGIINKVN